MKRTRLSMKLLWEIRDQYLFGGTEAAKNEAEETRRFLNFVADATRYTAKETEPRT